MSAMAEVLAAHWSRSTHTDSEPMVDKCDGCGTVIYTWGGDPIPDGIEPLAAHQAAELAKAGYGNMAAAFPIIRDLVDPDDCWFDRHGGCQAHGYLSLKPGETCPQHDAKQWLKANEGAGHG